MYVTDLVRIHETGIAHHVAAIGEVYREDRPAAVADRARTMLVQVLVIVRRNVAAREILLDPIEKLRINGHHVFVLAVDRAFLHHPDFAIALDDLRLYFADLFVHQIAPVFFPLENRLARILDAARAQGICLPWEAECGLRFLPRLQQRFVGPFRSERWVRIVLVKKMDRIEGNARSLAQDIVHCFPCTSTKSLRHFHNPPHKYSNKKQPLGNEPEPPVMKKANDARSDFQCCPLASS